MKLNITLNYVGYWSSDYDNGVTPSFLVGANPEPNKSNIIEYLRSGIRGPEFHGYARCRFECNESNTYKMGNTDLTDGLWVWPEGLSHYVDAHNLILPPAFIAHMKKSNFLLQKPPREFCHWFRLPVKSEDFSIKSNSQHWNDWLKQKGEEDYLKSPIIATRNTAFCDPSSPLLPDDWPHFSD